MSDNFNVSREDAVYYALQNLYTSFGYRLYKMRKFEEYSLYADNKSFLTSEFVITFNDLNGKLLALKPDVTLSIVKNTKADEKLNEKLFYRESVYRLDAKSREFKEINQIGLEFLGRVDRLSSIEVLSLAMQSLAIADDAFMLDLSHMGYVSAVTEALTARQRQTVINFIRNKNAHELRAFISAEGINEYTGDALIGLAECDGNAQNTLNRLYALSRDGKTSDALDELKYIFDYFADTPFADRLRLDFSVITDENYYNGIIFQGFVQGLPRRVLTGGRYDKLANKFKTGIQALGFAICLGDLNLYEEGDVRADAVIVYTDESDAGEVMRTAEGLYEQGLKFSIVREGDASCKCAKRIIRL